MTMTSTNLRVLLVTPRYFPLMGGIETHVYEVARRFAAQGVQTTVLTTDPGENLAPRERVEGVQIIRVSAYPKGSDFYVAPGVYREIVRERDHYDVVHCQGFHTAVPPLAMLAARKAGLPYLLSFHSGGHSTGWRNSIRSLQAKAMRPLLGGAKKLHAVSHFEAKLFAERLGLPADRFVVIPNGSHLPKLSQPTPADPDPLILSVGRLEKYKGHHRIIEAFPQVLQRRPEARLRVLGSGPYEGELHDQVRGLGLADRVEIGAIPPGNREGMAAMMSRASLITLMSEYEAHPIAVMEALSMRRPVLVADTSGLHELAERGLVRAIPLESSSGQVADAILEQLNAPLIPQQVELPTWDGCAAALLSLYRDIVDARATARQ